MTRRIVRLTATLGTAALFSLTGAALAGAASAAPITSSAAASPVSAYATHFVGWYPDKTSCKNGGEYYKRHGYSGYICQLDPTRGWALYVVD